MASTPASPASLSSGSTSANDHVDVTITSSSATQQPNQPSSSATTNKPLRRARTSKPKVKTGCATCKQRRIKCDEKRPACTQCVKSSKACVGYPAPSHSARPYEEIRIAPKSIAISIANTSGAPIAIAARPSNVAHGPLPLRREIVLPPRRVRRRPVKSEVPAFLSYQPSVGIPLRGLEGLYFSIFRAHTSAGLSGYFASSFWTRRVLQECHTEAAIRHAVLALGALYKTMEQTAEYMPHRVPGQIGLPTATTAHWGVAVKQYSEACTAMVQINNNNKKSHRTVIFASILLACFDSFIGDHRQAIIQIQKGFGLLEFLREQQAMRALPSHEDALEEDLITMFTRLAIQAKSFDLAFHFPEPYVVRLRAETPSPPGSPESDRSFSIPDYFSSLHEARMSLDRITESSSRGIDVMFAALNDGKGFFPSEWKARGLRFKSDIETWSATFEPIFKSRLLPTTSPLEKAGIASLKMFSLNSHMLLIAIFANREDQYDAFLSHFKLIADLGREIIIDEEKRAAAEQCPVPSRCTHRYGNPNAHGSLQFATPHVKPSFSAELGIIPPLFVVATKCRHPIIRREALQILKSSPRREGMWDSEMVAQISIWVMNLEESQSQVDLSALPPDFSPSVNIAGARPPKGGDDGVGEDDGSLPTLLPPGVLEKLIPNDNRVRIRSVDFDLRARYANVQVGTRGASPGMPDIRFHQTHITW